jgi:hypothetical protein
MRMRTTTYNVHYPLIAGCTNGSTSRDAATAIESSGRAAKLRERVITLFRCGYRLTADEAAAMLDEPILSVRPRIAEAHKLGKLQPTGDRRASSGGRPSHVWALTQQQATLGNTAEQDG